MVQERVEVLRDLLDIARVANGPQPPPTITVPKMEPLSGSEAGEQLKPARYTSFTFSEPSSSQRPPISPTKNKALTSRDVNAIQYFKSQLNEGDTLVYVRFPNGRPVYDSTGFRLSDIHRVHSEKLKAASPMFKEALENDWTQHRCKRRNKLLSGLPEGIKYVLDLTPPEEGDDALALTAELSCSLGIRRWYKSEHTGVATAHGLVGGKDETTIHPADWKENRKSDPPSPEDVQEIIDTAGATAVADTVAEINGVGNADVAFKTALEESKRLSQQKASQESDYTRDYNEKIEVDTLDYCPIRHRTGIERLLQIIEGKDPRLDSAPKVWTLAVLAKHFECHNAVVDYIVTWMIAEPNCKIFEILPEDCLRIGIMLQNEVATRYAFTILVSEEAFRIGTGRSDAANQPNTNYPAGKQVTKFGRARESLDEDTLNLIQHAGRNFHARIEQEVQLLLSPNMNWLHALPEFSKLLQFKDFLERYSTADDSRLQNVKKIINDLMHYIRGRLLWCFYQPLDEAERKNWYDHRNQERHELNGPSTHDMFITLSEHEKVMTRFYWGCMRVLKWQPDNHRCATNLIHDSIWPKTPEITAAEDRAVTAAEAHSIPRVYLSGIRHGVDDLNRNILKSIRQENFHKGEIPNEAYKVERLLPRTPQAAPTERMDYDYQRAQKNDSWRFRPDAVLFKAEPSSFKPTVTPAEKPGFWKDALKARDDAVTAEGSASSPKHAAPSIKSEASDSWLDEPEQEAKPLLDINPGRSKAWDRLQEISNAFHSSKAAPTVMPLTSPDRISNKNVSWALPTPGQTTEFPIFTRVYEQGDSTTATPNVPRDLDIGPSSPFFNLYTLFNQIDGKIQGVCNRMLSRGEIQNLRPPNCDICDTLLCLGEDEYKYLPLWANGLNDGTGGVFEEAIPPAERGGAMGPGPAYHTGSTVNSSRASTEIDFDGRSSVFGSAVDSDMSGVGGVNTSVGVEDGWSVDHIDRRRVFSETEFLTPSASEDGSVVWVGRDEDEEMMMNLPIREKGKGIAFDEEDGPVFVTNEREQAALLAAYSDFGSQGDEIGDRGKGKEKEGDTDMEGVESEESLSDAQKEVVRAVSMDDDENFFNTPDGDEEFAFESDDEGEETETEDDFEHVG